MVEGNLGAQAFYRSLGFVPKGVLARQVKIDERYEDEVFMELFVQSNVFLTADQER